MKENALLVEMVVLTKTELEKIISALVFVMEEDSCIDAEYEVLVDYLIRDYTKFGPIEPWMKGYQK